MGWNGLIGTKYDTIVSNYVVLPPISLSLNTFLPLKYILSYKPLFYCCLHTTTVQVLATSRLQMFHLRQKNYRKLAFEKVDCTGSTVLPIDVTSYQKIKYTSNKKKHPQTAIQSLKRLTILQYNLSLKLTQNYYCNNFSPELPYQWLLLV